MLLSTNTASGSTAYSLRVVTMSEFVGPILDPASVGSDLIVCCSSAADEPETVLLHET
jgi:hypothetical protein